MMKSGFSFQVFAPKLVFRMENFGVFLEYLTQNGYTDNSSNFNSNIVIILTFIVVVIILSSIDAKPAGPGYPFRRRFGVEEKRRR